MRTLAPLITLLALLTACRATWQEPDWMGLTEAELTREVGAPSSSHTLELTRETPLYEYQGGLARFTSGATTQVKELLWEGRFSTRVAWLRKDARGRWVVIDTLGWRADVAF